MAKRRVGPRGRPVRRPGTAKAIRERAPAGVVLLAAAVVLVPLAFIPGITEIYPGPKMDLLRVLAAAVLVCLFVSGFGLPAWRPARWLLAGLVLAELVSFAFAPDRLTAIFGAYNARLGIVTQLGMLCLGVGAATYLTSERLAYRALNWALLGAGLMAGYAFIQRAGLDNIDVSLDTRLYVISTLGNQNELAAYMLLAIGLLPSLMLLAERKSWFGSKPGWAAAGAMLFGIVVVEVVIFYTTSRGGLIGLAVALISLGVFAVANGWGARLVVKMAPLVAGALVVGFGIAFVSGSGGGSAERTGVRFATIGDSGDSAELRLGIWRGTLDVILAHPLFGIGQSGERASFDRDRSENLGPRFRQNSGTGADLAIGGAHNFILETLQHVGVFGALFVAGLGAWVAWAYWRLLRAGKSRLVPFLGAAALGYACVAGLNPVTIGPLTLFVVYAGTVAGLAPGATRRVHIRIPAVRTGLAWAAGALVLGGFVLGFMHLYADRQFTIAAPVGTRELTTDSLAASHRAANPAPWEAFYRRRELGWLRQAGLGTNDRSYLERSLRQQERLLADFQGLAIDYIILADLRRMLGLPGVEEALASAKAASPYGTDTADLIATVRAQAGLK